MEISKNVSLTDLKLTDFKLTDLELKMAKYFVESSVDNSACFFEDNMSWNYAKDLSKGLGWNLQKVGGVMTSLMEKGLLINGGKVDESDKKEIFYLTSYDLPEHIKNIFSFWEKEAMKKRETEKRQLQEKVVERSDSFEKNRIDREGGFITKPDDVITIVAQKNCISSTIGLTLDNETTREHYAFSAPNNINAWKMLKEFGEMGGRSVLYKNGDDPIVAYEDSAPYLHRFWKNPTTMAMLK